MSISVRSSTSRRLKAVVLATVLCVLAGLAIALFLAEKGKDSKPTATKSTAQVSAIRQGCLQWRSQATGPTPGSTWCSDLSQWVGARIGGTPKMWAGPGQARASCLAWADGTDTAGPGMHGPFGWCDSMIDWMSSHVPAWGGTDSWASWGNSVPA